MFIENLTMRQWYPGSGRKTISSGVGVFLLIVLVLLAKFFYPTSSRMATSENWRKDKLEKPLEKLSYLLNDSLPYREYKRKADSIRSALFREDLPVGGSGSNVFSFGVEEETKSNGKSNYFLTVSGYFMRDFFEYYALHGQNYIDYNVYGKENQDGVRFGVTKSIKTNLNIDQQNTREWQIGFPASRSQYHFFNALVWLLIVAFGVLLICAELLLPLQFLLFVANGKAFSKKAVRCLNLIATLLIFCAFMESVVRLGFHLYFRSQVPYPLTFYYYDDIMSSWVFLVSGMAVLLFAKAFRHGYDLQQDQDLTV